MTISRSLLQVELPKSGLEETLPIPSLNSDVSQQKDYVKTIRPIVKAFLKAKACEEIVSLLPSFTNVTLPRKSARLSADKVIETYQHLNEIALRVFTSLPKEETMSFNGSSVRTIVEQPELFLKLLQDATCYAIGSLLQGSASQRASVVERGRIFKKVLSLGTPCPLPTALVLSGKNLICVPREIEKCSLVKVLDLSHNKLVVIPGEVAKLKELTYLNLSANQLRNLPAEMGQLCSLEIVDLSCNPLDSFPDWLQGISSLKAVRLDEAQCEKFSQEIKSFHEIRKACQIEVKSENGLCKLQF